MKWPYTGKDVTKLQLEITSFCNLKCTGCEREFNKNADTLQALREKVEKSLEGHKYKPFEIDDKFSVEKHTDTIHMTFEKVKEWFTRDTLPSLNKVIFSGAIDDPASNPELYNICDYFSNTLGCSVNVNSNGSLRMPDFWKKLGSLGITVEFALDGLEDTLPIYRVGANYNKVIQNATAFIEAGGVAVWKFIDFRHNTHQIEEAKQIAKNLGFNRFLLIKTPRPSSIDIATPYEFEDLETPTVSCKSFNEPWLYVNYDGVMSPCCYFGYNERSKYSEDNLNNSTPEEFFESSKFLNDIQSSWNTDQCNRRCYIICKLNKKNHTEITKFE
jgi:hypothetical protein